MSFQLQTIQAGSLIRYTKNNYYTGVVISVSEHRILEKANTTLHGITRERSAYDVVVLFGAKLMETSIFFHHNSYQANPSKWTIEINPDKDFAFDWKDREIEVIA